MEDILNQILIKLDNLERSNKEKFNQIRQTMATKEELNGIRQVVDRIDSRLELVHNQVVRNTELLYLKADKEDIEKINKRLDHHLVRISKLEEEVELIKEAL